MRVVVVADPAPGHVFPALALCRRFAVAGDVPMLCTAGPWADAAGGRGIEARQLPALEPGRLNADTDLGRVLYGRAVAVASALVPLLAEVAPDLVVCDVLTPGGGMAAELLGVPWVGLSPHPLYEPSCGLPPIGSGLAVGTGVSGRVRDLVLRAATARSIRQGRRQQAQARRRVGLGPREPGPVARLIATLPALEVPRPDWPDDAYLVGPLLWEPTERILNPPPGDDPVVMIAPSTASIGVAGLAEMALVALRGAGVRAVVSTIDPVPAGIPTWVRAGQGRQDAVLVEASLVICGGGHGMLAKALLAGVPAVVVPGGGDQWELANRAARQGSALVVRPLTVDALREAVMRVLREPRFAIAAAKAAATATNVHDPVDTCHAALARHSTVT